MGRKRTVNPASTSAAAGDGEGDSSPSDVHYQYSASLGTGQAVRQQVLANRSTRTLP
ncbi:MAG: hypothetical protein IKR83_05445 [Bacteroidales bacterium]|nr:hypothetical protein [Bacteroidales bacterium]